MTTTNQSLLSTLKEQTQSLKIQFIEMTGQWAEKNFPAFVERLKWNEVKWCEYLGLTPEVKNPGTRFEFLGFPKGFYSTANSTRYQRVKDQSKKIAKMGLEDYKAGEEKKAENHYEESIKKLAYRIEAKGLNQDTITVKTSHIKQNIETVLTDGVKTVRAFTILAWGEVNAPHYRYLIK